jgi:hypothetical protein
MPSLLAMPCFVMLLLFSVALLLLVVALAFVMCCRGSFRFVLVVCSVVVFFVMGALVVVLRLSVYLFFGLGCVSFRVVVSGCRRHPLLLTVPCAGDFPQAASCCPTCPCQAY